MTTLTIRLRFLASVGAGALFSALLLPQASLGQELLQLRDEFVEESTMFDADIDNYLDARTNEDNALKQLIELNRQLDKAMADPTSSPDTLVDLDRQIGEARQEAFEISQDVASRRAEMGQRMRRLEQITDQLREGGVEYVESNGQLAGTWLIETSDAVAVLSLRQNRSQLSGIYRINNGRHGSASGRLESNGNVRIDLNDDDYGPVGSLEGQLQANGTLFGQWSARELAAGRQVGGTWTGQQLSYDELLSLNP